MPSHSAPIYQTARRRGQNPGKRPRVALQVCLVLDSLPIIPIRLVNVLELFTSLFIYLELQLDVLLATSVTSFPHTPGFDQVERLHPGFSPISNSHYSHRVASLRQADFEYIRQSVELHECTDPAPIGQQAQRTST